MNWLKKFDLKTIMIMILCVVLLFRSCGGGEEEEKEIINVDGKDYELLEQKTDTIYVEKEVKVTKYVPKYITKEVIKEVDMTQRSNLRVFILMYHITDIISIPMQW